MSAATYVDRFADALAWRLPDDVTVTNAQGMVVVERGNARTVLALPDARDRRKPPHESDIVSALTAAARKLRREVPKYKEPFRAPALELADLLDRATL